MGLFTRKKKVAHPDSGLYHYMHAPEFHGKGAGEFIFQPSFSLPTQVFRGAGTLAGTLSVLQGRQVNYRLATPTSGIGGTVAGQIVFQGLSDPNAIAASLQQNQGG